MRLVTGARVLGLLLMVACAGAAYWLFTASALKMDAVAGDLSLRYTAPDAVLAAAGLAGHPNVATLRSDAIRSAIESFPEVAAADVRIALPNKVTLDVTPRQAAFAIARPEAIYLVDADGLVLAAVAPQSNAVGVPVIRDERTDAIASSIAVGQSIDPIDLAAIRQLGAVTPTLIDSASQSLQLEVRDDDGFVLTAQPEQWQAVFGQYTPNLRPTDIIPRQVQCLRALVAASEAQLQTVYLTPLDERCGTYLPVPTPFVPTPAPTRSH